MKAKNNCIKIAMLVLVLVAAFATAAAQSQSPVRWRTFVKMTGPTEGTVTLRCLVAPGTHVYGMNIPEGGPKATSIDFSGSEGITFQGKAEAVPAAESVDDALFGMKLEQWSSNFEVRRKFRLTGPADKAKLNVRIVYMSCDNQNCRPPKTETITAKIPAYTK